MIRRSRTRTHGRHRTGRPAPPAPLHRRRWDATAQATAAELDRAHPGWTILYGVHSRRFYAIAAWAAAEPITVHGATAEQLLAAMAEAITESTAGTPRPTAAPSHPAATVPLAVTTRRAVVADRDATTYPPATTYPAAMTHPAGPIRAYPDQTAA